jgi:biopolymer transport protein ExbD
MAEIRRRRRRSREIVAADIEVMPLMNLFIVLIPLLLLSAVFIEVSVIDMALPSAAEAASADEARLDLTVHVGDGAYLVSGNGVATQRIERLTEGDGSHVPDSATRERLTAALRGVVTLFPAQKDVRIVSGPVTRYEEIVTIMDVARGAGLPNTALAGANSGANGS